jgi:hypothetical protein
MGVKPISNMRLTDLHGFAEAKMQKGNDVMSLVGYEYYKQLNLTY